MLKVLQIRSLQFLGNDKVLNDTLDLAGSGLEVQAISKVSKIINRKYLKNAILDSHNFLQADFGISTI